MKLPRDLSGLDPARAMGRVGYRITRQTGSHIRLTLDADTRHHRTIPAHQPLKVGTLAAVLNEVCARLQVDRAELLQRLGF